MPFWRNPIFLMEMKRFARPRVWPRGLLILAIAGALGGLHSEYQSWLQNLLFNTLPWDRWSFTVWELVYNALNPWRWISIFAVYYIMRAPMRLTEAEEFWVTRLRPRDILRGKIDALYVFFFFLFNLSLVVSVFFRHAYQTYVAPSPFGSPDALGEYWFSVYLNPAYYFYMILAPAYASVVLTALMLTVRNTARAMATAMLIYLVALPFAQDFIVSGAYDWTGRVPGLRAAIYADWLAWVPDTYRDSYFMMLLEYTPRSIALIILMLPFGAWLLWRYERLMIRNFEYRHF